MQICGVYHAYNGIMVGGSVGVCSMTGNTEALSHLMVVPIPPSGSLRWQVCRSFCMCTLHNVSSAAICRHCGCTHATCAHCFGPRYLKTCTKHVVPGPCSLARLPLSLPIISQLATGSQLLSLSVVQPESLVHPTLVVTPARDWSIVVGRGTTWSSVSHQQVARSILADLL